MYILVIISLTVLSFFFLLYQYKKQVKCIYNNKMDNKMDLSPGVIQVQ